MYCGTLGARAALNVCCNVLEYHNGVVHHVTDGDAQTRQRNRVQRTAGYKEVYERCNEREGDCNTDDDGCPPASEEDEHHQHHEYKCVDDCLGEGIYSLLDVLRCVGHNVNLYVRGKALLQFGKFLAHSIGNGYRVSTGLLLYDNHRTLLSVGKCPLGTLLCAVDKAGNVAQVDVRSFVCTHDKVHHILRRVELSLDSERVGVASDVEAAAGDIPVLRRNDVAHCLHRDIVCLHLYRVHIDVDLALGSTDDRYCTHSVDTCKGVGNIVVEYLV